MRFARASLVVSLERAAATRVERSMDAIGRRPLGVNIGAMAAARDGQKNPVIDPLRDCARVSRHS